MGTRYAPGPFTRVNATTGALALNTLLVDSSDNDLGDAIYGLLFSNKTVVASAASAATATPVELIAATAGGFWWLSIAVATQAVDISFDGGGTWALNFPINYSQANMLIRVLSTSAILIRDHVDTAHGTVTITARGPGA
jgi:hypothetical protein